MIYGDIKGYSVTPEYFPAGLIASQSIGERGTQLSMQSFHTGESIVSMDGIVNILMGKDPDCYDVDGSNHNWFIKKSDYKPFVERMKLIPAYQNLLSKHFELLWVVIHSSKDKTLSSAWQDTCTPLSSLAGNSPWKKLIESVHGIAIEDYTHPVSKLLKGIPPMDNK